MMAAGEQTWNISNAGQVVVVQGGVQGGIGGVGGGVTIGRCASCMLCSYQLHALTGRGRGLGKVEISTDSPRAAVDHYTELYTLSFGPNLCSNSHVGA
jgi:hypothetical protein